jgi:hypothetical protein
VVDHKLYWAAFSNVREAHYVAAMLNSKIANEMIKPFQSTGLLGERDIHKKLLDLPFPSFDHENPKHNDLAELGIRAWRKACQVVHTAEFPLGASTARQRAFIRKSVESELKQIDALVAKLWEK